MYTNASMPCIDDTKAKYKAAEVAYKAKEKAAEANCKAVEHSLKMAAMC